MLFALFTPLASATLISAHVLSSAPNGACDSQCSSWYSKTDDNSICNFLQNNFSSYTSCGQCNIGGALDEQSYWADQWNKESSYWYSQCPSEFGIGVNQASFNSDGSYSVTGPSSNGNGAVTTVVVQSVVTVYGAPPASTQYTTQTNTGAGTGTSTGGPLSTLFTTGTGTATSTASTATTSGATLSIQLSHMCVVAALVMLYLL